MIAGEPESHVEPKAWIADINILREAVFHDDTIGLATMYDNVVLATSEDKLPSHKSEIVISAGDVFAR